jgi:abortive infection bacteriophage resistance protein
MKFTKPALSFPDQADLLISRGLLADRDALIRRLEQVNYYRLSAYWHSFRDPGTETFRPGTKFDVIWDHYVFDRQLRVVVMDAIERVEVAVKTHLANELALKNGPFAHLDRANLPGLLSHQHRSLLDKIQKEEDRSRELFVKHFHAKYTSETNLPLWMAIEVMDFGTILTLFRGADQYTKRTVASRYGVTGKVLESWLVSLNYVRNGCAHHARLWNRVLSVAPLIPNQANVPDFHTPQPPAPDKGYAILTILKYLLNVIAPQSHWAARLERLWTEKHPAIPIQRMGFPADWKDCPIWAATGGGQIV